MFEMSKFVMAAVIALPIFVGTLPFVVMGKLGLSHVLKWLGISILAIFAASLLTALLTSCSFQDALFLLRDRFECRPISMLGTVFFSYVLLIASIATLPVVLVARALRQLNRPVP